MRRRHLVAPAETCVSSFTNGANALRHGALSKPKGKVTVDWTLATHSVDITWRERNGPKTSASSSYNFGSRLITRTPKQLNAPFEPTFAENGYCYLSSFLLSKFASELPGERSDSCVEMLTERDRRSLPFEGEATGKPARG